MVFMINVVEEVYRLSDLCRGSYWFFTYGGYAGDLSPKSTFELLSGNENVVLIDVRPEARDCKFFQSFLLWDTGIFAVMISVF